MYLRLVSFTLKRNFLNVYKSEIEKNTVIINRGVFDKNIIILSMVYKSFTSYHNFLRELRTPSFPKVQAFKF